MNATLPPLDERTLVHVLTAAAAESPDKVAVRDRTVALTYGQLLDEACIVAGGMLSAGIQPGDAVLLMLDNHVDYVLSWLGTVVAGAVEVPVNTAYKGFMLGHIVRDSAAAVIVIEECYLPALLDIIDDVPNLRTIIVRGDEQSSGADICLDRRDFRTLRQAAPIEPATPPGSALMAIMYTSGTTGPSKGVRITHAHAYGYCTPAMYGAASVDDTVLVVLPLFHIGGQWAGVYNSLIARAECVVLDRFHSSAYWDDVREFGCTYTLLLGAMAGFLHNMDPSPHDADVPLSRVLMVPAIPQVAEFADRFGCAIATAYGATEASTPIYTQFGQARYGTCGTLHPDFEARLVDSHDREVPRGEAGELLLRANEPWVLMDGYHGNPEATARVWRNQWLHTGDAFVQESNGEFRFVDRTKDALRRRGENISSFEVESGGLLHPDIVECAVVGVSSEHTEEEILLVARRIEGSTLTETDLADFMAQRMPRFMVPRYVRFSSDLPKTPTQKIKKNELRAQGITPETWDRELNSSISKHR